MSDVPTVHACCVVVAEAGVLIRGRPGSGKSSLSAALIDHAASRGLFARLVADDRVRLAARSGRLVATTPRTIAGLIERRGVGVVETPHLARAVVRLVVDLEHAVERIPDVGALTCEIEGVTLPRLVIPGGAPDGPALTLLRLGLAQAGGECGAIALAFGAQKAKMKQPMVLPSIFQSGRAGVARGGPLPERNEFCAETA